MKKLASFYTKLEAELAAQYLSSHEIQNRISGAREYASHITGNDFGKFDLLVHEESLSEAESLLNQSKLAPVDEERLPDPRLYLKKAIVFAIFACMFLPLIFNYFSLKNLNSYLNSESDSKMKNLYTGFVLILQLPALFILYLMISSFVKG